MSLRPIEMQGSFPLSQKAGKIQEQMQQRGQVGQEIISEQLKLEEDKKRKQVNEADESDKTRFHHEDNEGNQQQEKQEQKREKKAKLIKAEHPFKGKFVDFSG
ncbi:hypothetical protein [Halalkalibacter urbisdiaboli]|uniref:hypothetical protein n=1 Tax=Halalkalibacter urbisdiaboli TaxID=1960589 RepID=UPI000B42F2B7|nr:hypothetical protein [Halalkalibacter urbisdiaboli]